MTTTSGNYDVRSLYQAAGASNGIRLAAQIGVSYRTLMRWAHTGVPEYSADRAAIALGLHPASIWPAHWWEAAA